MFGNPFQKRSPPQGAARFCSTRTVSRAPDERKRAARAGSHLFFLSEVLALSISLPPKLYSYHLKNTGEKTGTD
jgi:hypothetical protein